MRKRWLAPGIAGSLLAIALMVLTAVPSQAVEREIPEPAFVHVAADSQDLLKGVMTDVVGNEETLSAVADQMFTENIIRVADATPQSLAVDLTVGNQVLQDVLSGQRAVLSGAAPATRAALEKYFASPGFAEIALYSAANSALIAEKLAEAPTDASYARVAMAAGWLSSVQNFVNAVTGSPVGQVVSGVGQVIAGNAKVTAGAVLVVGSGLVVVGSAVGAAAICGGSGPGAVACAAAAGVAAAAGMAGVVQTGAGLVLSGGMEVVAGIGTAAGGAILIVPAATALSKDLTNALKDYLDRQCKCLASWGAVTTLWPCDVAPPPQPAIYPGCTTRPLEIIQMITG